MTDNIEPGSRDAEEASPDVRRDDDDAPSIATILASIRARSEAEKAALRDASGDRENTALPGPFARSSDTQVVKIVGKPSLPRSSASVYSQSLLHSRPRKSELTSRKTSGNHGRGYYTALLHNRASGPPKTLPTVNS